MHYVKTRTTVRKIWKRTKKKKKLHSNRVIVKFNQKVDHHRTIDVPVINKRIKIRLRFHNSVNCEIDTASDRRPTSQKHSTSRPTTCTCLKRGLIFVSNIIIGKFTRTSQIRTVNLSLKMQLGYDCISRPTSFHLFSTA